MFLQMFQIALLDVVTVASTGVSGVGAVKSMDPAQHIAAMASLPMPPCTCDTHRQKHDFISQTANS